MIDLVKYKTKDCLNERSSDIFTFQAGLISPEFPEQLVIALEPEVASIYCRKLKMHQLVPEFMEQRPLQSPEKNKSDPMNLDPACADFGYGK